MKEIGYRIFAFMYMLYRCFPLKKNSAFLIMTHDGGREGNVAVEGEYFRKTYGTEIERLRRDDTIFSGKQGIWIALKFFLIKSWKMARAEYIFMDNTFLPMAYLKVRQDTKVVQLWHGTGTIKKFGQHVNKGKVYELEKKANRNIDYVVVNSEATRELYAECFSVDVNQVKVLGLPRTDILFSEREKKRRREYLLNEFPELIGKKLILYAPTFRDQDVEHPQMYLDVKRMEQELADDYIIGLRLHPFIAKNSHLPEINERIIDFSRYPNLNTLLMATDILITDYSSIIFEYCVFQKPMIFFAYDLDEFSNCGRGFYRDYKSYVPGPVVSSTEEIIQVIKNKNWKSEKWELFFKEAYQYTDGNATIRIANFLKNEQG